MKNKLLAVLLLGLAFGVQLALSQVTNGTISGTVSDSTGAVLPGAEVVIVNEDTGISRTVLTDSAGRYSAPALSLAGTGQRPAFPAFRPKSVAAFS